MSIYSSSFQLPHHLPSPLAPTESRMEKFWYWLTKVHLEKWPSQWKESNSERIKVIKMVLSDRFKKKSSHHVFLLGHGISFCI